MKILFTTSAAPDKSPFSTAEKRPPLGVGSLMAVASQKGHEVLFLDNYLDPSGFPANGYLEEHDIDLVAIYANTICYRDTLRMLEELQALRESSHWQGRIAVGGPHTAVALDTIPQYVDYVVCGEGENALIDILDGRAHSRVIRGDRVEDLDALPYQPWDIFGGLSYDMSCQWMDEKPVYTMNTSRGCPFHCSFCSVASVWGKTYKYQSAERVVEEMAYLIKEYKAQGFYFREDHFTLNLKRTERFCTLLLEKGIKTAWACETRVDRMRRDLVQLMARAGCKAVYLGVESGSLRMLELLNKKITIEQIEDTIRWCKEFGIRCYCSLVTGVPGETYQDYLMTEKLMKRLKPFAYSYNVFVGIPTSPLYEQILRDHSYEYKDDLGLLYLPGFNIKTQLFYGRRSHAFVDYDFKKLTAYDLRLFGRLWKQRTIGFASSVASHLPEPVKNSLKSFKRSKGSSL